MNENKKLNILLNQLDELMAAVVQENYLNVDDPNVMALLPEIDTPEKLLIRKERVSNLSAEARQVIEIIYNAPKELIAMIPLNKDFVSPNNLQKYLKRNGWCRNRILSAFRGIRKMLKEGED